MQAPPSLFTDGTRPDTGPPPYATRGYELLDSSSVPEAWLVREQVDAWYRRLPGYGQEPVAARFRSEREGTHLGAFLELYLHELALRLDADPDLDVGREDPDHRRPDLLLQACGQDGVWLEATAVLGDDVLDPADRHRRDVLYDLVNAVDAPAWSVDVDVLEAGNGQPGRRNVTDKLQRWLDRMDPDNHVPATADDPAPELPLDFQGWRIVLTARGLAPEHRDYPGHRVVGTRFDGVSMMADDERIRSKVKDKATHYGTLDRPYVVATLLDGSFAGDDDIEEALLGSLLLDYSDRDNLRWVRRRDGAWMGPTGPVNTRLSAVLTLRRLSPWTVPRCEPVLWLNPWAGRPIHSLGPWQVMALGDEGRFVERRAATRSVADVLNLDQAWPRDL